MPRKKVRRPFSWGEFGDPALDVLDDPGGRINILEGAVRSGKTIVQAVKLLDMVATAPEGDLLLIGKTERTLKRNLLDPIESMIGANRFSYNRADGEIWIDNRLLYVAGANDAKAEGKIRGLTIAGAGGDEVTLWPEDLFAQMLARMSVPGAQFWGTTNPDSPFHWLKVRYIDRASENGLHLHHFNIDDNPNLDPEYVEALKREFTGIWYKRFILGLWVLAEGAIFDMFDEDKHVKKAPADDPTNTRNPAPNRFIIAGDYGTKNPCTFGLYGWRGGGPPTGDPIYLMDEYYYDGRANQRQKTDSQYADDFIKWAGNYLYRAEAIYFDPSATSFITELRHRGLIIREADNAVRDGIRYVSSLLGSGLFYIDPECKETIREFGSYVWDEKASSRGEDIPIKQNDHAMDRNRYALWSHFGKGYVPGGIGRPGGA